MSEHVIEYDCECTACDATGLYIGMAEHDGAAVQCSRCKGTGMVHHIIKYTDFVGRKKKKGVVRVLRYNPGIGVGTKGRDGQVFDLAEFGGMPYEDWEQGKPFPPGSEMRLFCCPCWWYQNTDYDRKPDWKECIFGGTFSSCKHFPTKDRCWARWDRENKKLDSPDRL